MPSLLEKLFVPDGYWAGRVRFLQGYDHREVTCVRVNSFTPLYTQAALRVVNGFEREKEREYMIWGGKCKGK